MTGDDERLARLLGGAERGDLRRRLRQRFERGGQDGDLVVFRLSGLAANDATLLASLMGRPVRLGTATIEVDVPLIDAALQRAGLATSLRNALERLDGPIQRRSEMMAETARRWSGLVAARSEVRLAAWLGTAPGLGVLKRLSRQDVDLATELCRRAEFVLAELPARGIPRAQLAARVLGDAHALDAGAPAATVVLAALRHADRIASLRDEPERDTPAGSGPPGAEYPADVAMQPIADMERDRHVWARAGVLVNELARPALVLNLPLAGGTVWGGRPGEPVHITLRALVRTPPVLAVQATIVSVCENPNVVAIVADGLGVAAAPLVCTEGMPAAAQRTLLLALAAAGAKLRYHGDFDWPGLRIAATVMRLSGAVPWRFTGDAYTAAVERFRGAPLAGAPAPSPWDPGLASHMEAQGLAIAEEAAIQDLLGDLRSHGDK